MTERDPPTAFGDELGERWRRVRLYVLVTANRAALTGALVVALFAVLVALGYLDGVPLRARMRTSDPVETLFQTFVGAVVTGVTLVVTISQLVLSQETGPLGDQRDRMEGTIAFRRDAADVFEAPSPPEPSSFLRALVDVSRERAARLDEAITGVDDPELREAVHRFVDGLEANAVRVSEQLATSTFGSYGVLHAALSYDYSWKLYQVHRFRREFGDALDEESRAALEDLLEVLELIAPARAYAKTLYFQWALVDLSREILYASLPALVVATGTLLYVDPWVLPGETLGIDNLIWLVAAAIAVVTAPFLLLVTYILRLATIAKHTVDIGPFVLERSDRSHEIEWE